MTTSAGTSATGATDHFSYLPVVTEVSPISGPLGGGTVVIITGVDFTGVTTIEFGSTEASGFTVHSATSITATSPPEAIGKVHVRVITPVGISPISAKSSFKFTPTVTSVRPNTGSEAGGTLVTVKGAGFNVGRSATRFKFGPAVATQVQCATTTECTMLSPEHEQPGTVDVRATVDGVFSPKAPADQFTYHGGLFLRTRGRGRLGVGTQVEIADALDGCYGYAIGTITEEGEATVRIRAYGVEEEEGGCAAHLFGTFPSNFTLEVSSAGAATIAGPVGVITPYLCVYQAGQLSSQIRLDEALYVDLKDTFTLTGGEEEECSETAVIFGFVEVWKGLFIEEVETELT